MGRGAISIADRKSSRILFAAAVLVIQLVGAVSLWLHQSNDPVILGRYALDFFAFMVIYHLALAGWIGLLVGLWLGNPTGIVGRLSRQYARRSWFWVGLIALWMVVLGFTILTIYRIGSISTLIRLVAVISGIYLTGYALDLRGYHPQRYASAFALIGTGLLVTFFVVYYFTEPYRYVVMLLEDGPVEWMTFALFLLSSLTAFYAANRFKRTGRLTWYLLGVGLLCFFIAGEEISWGQRILGFSTPEALREINSQGETSVHNIDLFMSRHVKEILYAGGVFFLGAVIPLISLSARVKALLDRFAIIVPSVSLIPLFLVAVLAYLGQPAGKGDEVAEFLIGLGILLMLVIGYLRQLPIDGNPREEPAT